MLLIEKIYRHALSVHRQASLPGPVDINEMHKNRQKYGPLALCQQALSAAPGFPPGAAGVNCIMVKSLSQFANTSCFC